MHDFEGKKREILDRVGIVDVVAEHVTLRRNGRRLVGLCPFHVEKTPSFTVTPDMGLFKCFGCGRGGDAFSFVQLKENVSFAEAMRMLADRAGVELKFHGESSDGVGRVEIAKVNEWAQRFFERQLHDPSLGASALAYAVGRGFTEESLRRFCVGLAVESSGALLSAARRAGHGEALLVAADLARTGERGDAYDTFRHRLIFPIRDATKRVIGFGGRTLADDKAKYLNTRQNALFDKGRCLYGVDLARDAMTQRGRAVLVEGYADCMACHQAGFEETVATLGTALTETQVDLVRRYCEEMILLFDSDAAGEAAADRAIKVALPRCVRVRLARIPEGKDPADFLAVAGGSAFHDVLNGSVDALEFKWLQTQTRYEGGTSDAHRRQAVVDFLGVVAEAFETTALDVVQRGLLVNQVAHLLRLRREEIDAALRRVRPGKPVFAPNAASPATAARAARPNARQLVWSRVLEVLLNEPGLIDEARSALNFEAAVDEAQRRVALTLVSLAEERGGFALADVLACCQNADESALVADLARRGSDRGNFGPTLRNAIDHLCRIDAAQAESVASGMSDGMRPVDTEAIREHRHFAPRRMIRGAI